MTRPNRARRGAPTGQTASVPNVSINLKELAATASIVVGDGDYEVEIVEADVALNTAKDNVSIRLTPQVIREGTRIRLQPLCIHDGMAQNTPWYIPANAKKLTDIIEAAGREVPDNIADTSVLVGAQFGARFIETTDGRGMGVNELVDVWAIGGDDA